MGVWIEIRTYQKNCWSKAVTPCVGVWIEILHLPCSAQIQTVTPCVGVWIEIFVSYEPIVKGLSSLPVWECGLKLPYLAKFSFTKQSLPVWECGLKLGEGGNHALAGPGHSLCGSVD